MIQLYLVTLVAVTSAAACALGRRKLNLRAKFGTGIRRTLETIGVAVAFFVINFGVTVIGILVVRSLGFFLSLYIAADYTLIVLSFLQAVVFQHWRYADVENR